MTLQIMLWTNFFHSTMEHILLAVLVISTCSQFSVSLPLFDGNSESRPPSTSVPESSAFLSYNSMEDDQTETTDEVSAVTDDVHCKVQLRGGIEQCLKGFEFQKEVFGNPNLTSQQRTKLTPDFCRAHELTLQCLYFALQKCSANVVTDFLPLIELRIGVWKTYMERLCNHGNRNNQTPTQHTETTTLANKVPHSADDKLNLVVSPSLKSKQPQVSSAVKLLTELTSSKKFMPEELSLKSDESRNQIQIDCSLQHNAVSPQCAHIALLLSSSSQKPSQTIPLLLTSAILSTTLYLMK